MHGPDIAALRAVVRGHVQAVGFREYVTTRARVLGLSGYVRNLPDPHEVEVVAEGPRAALDQLLEYLHQGPRMSRVDQATTEWGAPTRQHQGFRAAF